MGIKLDLSLASPAVFALTSAIDATIVNAGGGNFIYPKLRLYSGDRPATLATDITNQILLVEYQLNDPSFTNPLFTSDMVLSLPAQKLALATGVASFFRIIGGGNQKLLEGSITDRDGDGDLKISTIDIVMGQYVRPLSFTISIPQDQTT